MVSALPPGSSGLGWSTGQGHCVVVLGNTVDFHPVSLHPGIQKGTGDGLASHPKGWGVEIFLVAS